MSIMIPIAAAFLFGWVVGESHTEKKIVENRPIVIEGQLHKCHQKDMHSCKLSHKHTHDRKRRR